MLIKRRHWNVALTSASLATEHIRVNQDVPLVSQQQVTVESPPANADVVIRSGSRRAQSRRTAGCWRDDHGHLNRKDGDGRLPTTPTGGAVQKPRGLTTRTRRRPFRCGTTGCRVPLFHTGSSIYPYFDPIAQKAFDADS